MFNSVTGDVGIQRIECTRYTQWPSLPGEQRYLSRLRKKSWPGKKAVGISPHLPALQVGSPYGQGNVMPDKYDNRDYKQADYCAADAVCEEA
jgi:hypothetical protein